MNIKVMMQQVVNNLEPEFRIPVLTAAEMCDGTVLGFHRELVAQVWDAPELPVQDIIDQVSYVLGS